MIDTSAICEYFVRLASWIVCGRCAWSFSQNPIEPSFPLSSTLFNNFLCCIKRQMQLGQAGRSGRIHHGCSISTTSYKAVFKSAAQSLAEGGVPNCWMDTFPFVQQNSIVIFVRLLQPKFFFAKTKHKCRHICFMHGVWYKSCFQLCLKSVPRPRSSRKDLIYLTTSITKIEKVCLMKRCKTVEPSDQNYLQK